MIWLSTQSRSFQPQRRGDAEELICIPLCTQCLNMNIILLLPVLLLLTALPGAFSPLSRDSHETLTGLSRDPDKTFRADPPQVKGRQTRGKAVVTGIWGSLPPHIKTQSRDTGMSCCFVISLHPIAIGSALFCQIRSFFAETQCAEWWQGGGRVAAESTEGCRKEQAERGLEQQRKRRRKRLRELREKEAKERLS